MIRGRPQSAENCAGANARETEEKTIHHSRSPEQSFRPSMLINDTRYRSLTFQVIALVSCRRLCLARLEPSGESAAAGLNITYDFLGQSSGYDINQTLIEYSSHSTHGAPLRGRAQHAAGRLPWLHHRDGRRRDSRRAAPVEELARAKLMAVYVEAFRNVPVLIWIVIIFAIMTARCPRRARSAARIPALDAVRRLRLHQPWRSTYTSPSGGPAPSRRAVLPRLDHRRSASPLYKETAHRPPASGRHGPGRRLAFLFLPPLLALPADGPFGRLGSRARASTSTAASTSGLADRAVPGTGLLHRVPSSPNRACRHPGHPRRPDPGRGLAGPAPLAGDEPGGPAAALRVVIPPVISQYLNLTKNSSLAIAVGYMDMTGTLGGITLNQTGGRWNASCC